MGFRGWWNKQKLWVKGGLSGILMALAIYFFSFTFPDSEFSRTIASLGPLQFCEIFNLGFGETCTFVYLFYGWMFLIILYGSIGLLLGFFIEKIKK